MDGHGCVPAGCREACRPNGKGCVSAPPAAPGRGLGGAIFNLDFLRVDEPGFSAQVTFQVPPVGEAQVFPDQHARIDAGAFFGK